MNKYFLLLPILFLFSVTSAQNLLERYDCLLTPPLTYTCFQPTDSLIIDGKLDEASWRLASETTSFVDICGNNFSIPYLNTTAKMLWDDQYLYVGATLAENNIVAHLSRRDTILYYDNDFEVFIDPDGDGKNYFEIEINARGTLFDLMIIRPYRCGGEYLMQWDCPGLRSAVHLQGTLNHAQDTDRYWTVEMAIPKQALNMNRSNALQAGNTWRVNFSRVQWPNGSTVEENWVWSPIGIVDMHCPERWGYVYLSPSKVGNTDSVCSPLVDPGSYSLLWAMFYAQQDYYRTYSRYLQTLQDFFLTQEDLHYLPKGAAINVEAAMHSFRISISDIKRQLRYVVNQEGEFVVESMSPRIVKNWVWTALHGDKSLKDWQEWFHLLKECGISAVLFEGYDEEIFKLCKSTGLEAHLWHWTMARGECIGSHPDWYAVNRDGKSAATDPAYVDYYHFLCPSRNEVKAYLADDYAKVATSPYIDGVHLDYVRMPDVILPVTLWKQYNIIQKEELPAYDYCYCDVCRHKYKTLTGKDPLDLAYPMASISWTNFRLDAITQVVDTITKAVRASRKSITAAVFPGPYVARSLVRQDWTNWSLDAYFPMIYNQYYDEPISWIGRSVRESVQAVDGRAPIYAGLMFGHIKQEFEKALDEAFDNGASGVAFFAGPDEEYLQRFKLYLDTKGFVIQ